MGPRDRPDIAAMQVQMGSGLLSQQTVERTLQLVTEVTGRTLPSAVAVSVTVQRDDGLQTAAATDNVARDLDEVQNATEHGPCVEALHRRAHHQHQPQRRRRSLARLRAHRPRLGVGSVLSVPLPTTGPSLGSLNIYSKRESPLHAGRADHASLLAEQVAAALANVSAFSDAAAVNVQLLDALQTRDHIGQAKGILMERESCSAEAAFDILRRASQRTNRKLREVAEDLIRSVSERGTGD